MERLGESRVLEPISDKHKHFQSRSNTFLGNRHISNKGIFAKKGNQARGRPNRTTQFQISDLGRTSGNNQDQLAEVNLRKENNADDIKFQHKVLRFWFLLERELVEAITKGNLSLLDIAWGKINFLTKIIDPSLMEEGLK